MRLTLKRVGLFLLLVLNVHSVFAKEIWVGIGEPITSIRLGIQLAKHGDTIWVKAGHYQEGNLIVDKSITLLGIGLPVLDGEMKHEILTIAAQNVWIEGFKFKDSGRSSLDDVAAIKCLDAHKVTIKNNQFVNTFFAIHLSNTNDATIDGNHLQAFAQREWELGNGIHLWKCKDAIISNNFVKGHRDGIYFEFVTGSHIKNNECIENVRYGLHFMFSHDDTYTDNVFTSNGAGVSVMYSKQVRMYRNTFQNNWGSSAYGMLLKDIRDSEVHDNLFIGNTSGIYMEGSSRIIFTGNTFRENGWAIKLMASCDDNVLKRNNFMANTFDLSTNGSLVLNNIDGNYWDKYKGYDLNRDQIGDIPYHPVSLFTSLVEQIPAAMLLWRSFMSILLDHAEKVIPVITPIELKDNKPTMNQYDFSK